MQLGSVCRCSPIFMRCRVLPSRLQLRGCRGLIGGPDFGCRTSTGSRMIHAVVDEFVRHFRFAPALWPRLREAMSPAWVRSLTNPASYSAIRANMPKTSLPWAGSGVDDPVGQRLHPDPAAFEGGDDVDEVAQVPADPVDFPDDQGVAGLVGLMRMSMAVGSPIFR